MLKTQQNLNNSNLNISQKIDITFQNLYYTVQVPSQNDKSFIPCFGAKKPRHLLDGVSGICKGGEVTAIMGPSGSGKTTLLNTLAYRVNENNLKGTLLLNKKPYDFQKFGDYGNYVMQNDILFETMTVRETLRFVAKLTLNHSEEVIEEILNELIKSLKLQKCLDVIVGGKFMKGISGGQRKRTSIAFELIGNPQMILLDQPTSGLDSLTAFLIVRLLQRLAKQKGKTIIMVIHQPNMDIYKLVDRLILLADGKCLYQGRADEALQHFNSIGFRPPVYSSTPDFLMSIIHPESKVNVNNYPFYISQYNKRLQSSVKLQIKNGNDSEVMGRVNEVAYCISLGALLSRDWTNIKRNPMVVSSRIVQGIILGVFTGGLFYNVGAHRFTQDETIRSVHFVSLAGNMFNLCVSALMSALAPVTLTFPIERQVFIKERGARLYGVGSYFFSRNLVQFPFIIILPFTFTIFTYWMSGLSATPQQFFLHCFIFILVSFAGASIGLTLGSMISDPKLVSTLMPMAIVPVMVFSGFFKNAADLPNWIGWFQYISPLRYGMTGMLVTELQNRQSPLNDFNLGFTLWASIGLLAVIGVGFRIISLFFLWFLKKKLQ